MAEQLGDGLLGVMREIKASFDPHNLFNPGKVVPDGRFKIDTDLRLGAGHELKLPFTPVLAFAAKDGSFTAQPGTVQRLRRLPQRNAHHVPDLHRHRRGNHEHPRAGQRHSRRAGVARRCRRRPAALRGAGSRVEQLPLLQSLHDRMPLERQPGAAQGRTAARAAFSATACPGASGWSVRWISWASSAAACPGWPTCAGLALRARRPVEDAGPRLAAAPARTTPGSVLTIGSRAASARRTAPRGRVVLWDDTFVRYHEPHIGIAAVKVLEAAGFEVALPRGREVLRPARLQPGQPGRGDAAGPPQPGAAQPATWTPRRSCSWNPPAIPCSSRTTAS